MEYNDYIIRSILANNQFGIVRVDNLESLKSISFIREEYDEIESFIISRDINAIKNFHENQPRNGEYLGIKSFSDQNRKPYIVTVYDSDALEQDPQVIEIYSV